MSTAPVSTAPISTERSSRTASVGTDFTLTVNDEPRTLPAGTTCRDLVQELTGRDVGVDGRPTTGAGLGIALAVDGALVPRTAWHDTLLCADQNVEVVTAVQGG